VKLTPIPVRKLSYGELGLKPLEEAGPAGSAETEPQEAAAEKPVPLPILDAKNDLLVRVRELMADGFAGVILSGQPGTSKTYYARRIAATLCEGEESRIAFVQFHPSYQYEDFIETYQPTAAGGFAPKPRVFLEMCDFASASGILHVLVIDELSRTDAVRVFGEALTYLEAPQRGVEFELASGRRVSIPKNLFIVATMNPWDRGVDELDMAFERRFAKISLEPSAAILRSMLANNKMSADLIDRVAIFFDHVQRLESPHARIGHAYFARVSDAAGLRRLWENQLSHHFRRAFRFATKEFDGLKASWDRVLAEPAPPEPAAPANPAAA
jgi:5-methylcytosine-specific restriction enzyme B